MFTLFGEVGALSRRQRSAVFILNQLGFCRSNLPDGGKPPDRASGPCAPVGRLSAVRRVEWGKLRLAKYNVRFATEIYP
jgi:hypothetical protein